MLLTLFIMGIAMVFAAGIYSLVTTRNLIRVVISLEVLTKAVTLLIILAGAIMGRMAEAQTFAIMLIVIEVIVTAIAAGIVIGVYQHNGSVDTRNLTNLRE
jgi:NADH:ubiquinone oxidoreductase subunit K